MALRRTAVVTGSSSGIGRALVMELCSRGIEVIGCARREGPGLDGYQHVELDLADQGAVEQLFEHARARLGDIGLWVNNAGLLDPIGPLADIDPSALDRSIAVNVAAVAHASARFAAHVADREGPGVLLNVSSGAASSAHRGWAHYCAAKSYVERLTEAVALEGAVHGLRAHSVAPGVVDTEMQELIRSTPLSRFPDRPRFDELFEQGGLRSVEAAASKLADLGLEGEGQAVVLRV